LKWAWVRLGSVVLWEGPAWDEWRGTYLNSNIYRMGGVLYDVFGAVWIPHRFRLPLDPGISVPFLVFHVGDT